MKIWKKDQWEHAGEESGFTLVELLVVMGILAILAATIIPRFTGRTEENRKVAAKSSIRSLSTALNVYESDNGFFPSSEQGLMALIVKPGGDPEPTNWKQYLPPDSEMKDPWGNPFVYRAPGDRNPESFDLYSLGPDRKEGTDDDLNNWGAREHR